jgi:hypothetical protein
MRRLYLALAGLLLLGCAAPLAPPLAAQQLPASSVRLDALAADYHPGGSLGFSPRDTALDEQLYQREQGAEQGLLWSARFVSRWSLTEDQLDRWSAQVVGLLTDALGGDVRLGGWERLRVDSLGDRHVAYSYALVTSSGAPLGQATVVVFTRGDTVGLSGSAAIGSGPPIGAVALARLMDVQGQRG